MFASRRSSSTLSPIVRHVLTNDIVHLRKQTLRASYSTHLLLASFVPKPSLLLLPVRQNLTTTPCTDCTSRSLSVSSPLYRNSSNPYLTDNVSKSARSHLRATSRPSTCRQPSLQRGIAPFPTVAAPIHPFLARLHISCKPARSLRLHFAKVALPGSQSPSQWILAMRQTQGQIPRRECMGPEKGSRKSRQ